MAIPPLERGQYYYDGAGALYFAPADGAAGTGTTPVQVTHSYSFFPQYLTATELYLLQSGGLTITVQHSGYQKLPDGSQSVIFAGGTQYAGYAPSAYYYPSGTALTNDGETSSPPSAAGHFTWQNSSGAGIFQFNSGDVGKQIVIVYPYLDPDYDSTAVSLAGQAGMQIDFMPGTSGQAPPASLANKHPDQFGSGQLGYTDTALAYQDGGYLGTSGTLPNYTYEVIGSDVVGAGVLDADPILAIQTLLTDPRIGINFPASAIDNASWFANSNSASNWVNANQFYVSQAITNPTALSGIVGRWLEAFNIAAVWSEGVCKLIPYGDQSISSSTPVSATYTPNLTIAANLTDDDYLLTTPADPVKITRSSWADAYNRVQVGYRNRLNAYNSDLVFEEDQGAIARFGLRIEGQQVYDFASTWQLASAIANMRLKRLQSVRNTYQFSLPLTYEWLEPMDLVSLTDTRLGLAAQTVRITKITNDPAKGLQIEAEDFPGNGYAMPIANTKAATPALHPVMGTASAGETQVVIVQASDFNAASQTPSRIYIWVRGKDSSTWGSADIYRSLDGSNWEQMSVAVSAAPIYLLTASLPAIASNPQGSLALTHDTSSTLAVQPATSGNIQPVTTGITAYSPDTNYAAGQLAAYDGDAWVAQSPTQGNVPTDSDPHWLRLQSVTAAQGAPPAVSDAAAANLQNLVAVVGSSTLEFLSYANVAAGTLPNTFNLTDLYRGALGTTPQAAPANSVMVQFSAASATWDIPAGLAGQTVYFRVVARNVRAYSRQTLDTAETISFVVQAPGSDAAWDSLGGIIGDVIGNSGGTGEILTTAKINDSNSTTVGNVAISAVTGTQRNLVPDPDLRQGFTLWGGPGNSVQIVAGPNGGLIFYLPGGANFIRFGSWFPVTAGQPVTLSAYEDATSMTNGYVVCGLDWAGRSTVFEVDMYCTASGGPATPKGRINGTLTVPAGVTQMRAYYGQWAVSGTATGVGYIGQVQVEAGAVMTAYRTNYGDDLSGGPAPSHGKNLIPNPGFELPSNVVYWPATPAGSYPVQGWVVEPNANVNVLNARARGNYNQHGGVWDLEIINALNVALPANTSYECRVWSQPISVRYGETVLLTGWRQFAQGVAPAAGVTIQVRIGIAWYDNLGNQVSEAYPADMTSPTGWTEASASYAVPSGASYCKIECAVFLFVGSSNVTTDATNPWIDAFFDDLSLVALQNYDTEIIEPGVYWRIPSNHLDPTRHIAWAGLTGDTSGDTSTAIVDATNKRFLHTAMSGGVRGVIDTTGYIYPASGLGSGYSANLGLIHDQATMPVVCPVTANTPLPQINGDAGATEFTPIFSVPSWLTWTAYVSTSIADVIVDCSGYTGYCFRLDGRSGSPFGSILRCPAFGTGFVYIAQGANNSANVTGWHLIQAWVGRGGFMQLYIDGNLICSATDTTYTPNGHLWGQYEVAPASIGPASAATPDPTQLDRNARALIDFTQSGHLYKDLSNIADDPAGTWRRVAGVNSSNVLGFKSLIGDTSGDNTTAIVDAANKRFLHGAMSTPAQNCINSSSQFVGTQGISGTLAPYNSDLATLHDRMSVKNPQNLVIDDDFEGGSYGHWSAATATLSVVSVTGQKFAHALQITKTGTNYDAGDGGGEFDFPVKGSEYLWVQFWANTSSSTTSPGFGLMTGEGGSTPSSYVSPAWPGISVPASTGWTFYSGWIQLDSAAALARVYIAWHAAVNDSIQIAQLYIGRMRPAPTLNNVAIDGSGVTLGYSGYPQLVIGQGTITLPTGGASAYQVKKTLYTASTGTQANGTVISFSSLTDQSGNALPTFDHPPLVALQPYNMSTPPVLLYASSMTTTGFTLNSYSSGTPGTSSGITLSGTDTLYNVPGGGVANSVQFVCKITSPGIGGGTARATFDCYINDTLVGTVNVAGPNNGSSYQTSQSFPTSGSPTSVNLKFTVPSNSGISGDSCTAYVSYTSGTTPVSANVTCAIAEPWA